MTAPALNQNLFRYVLHQQTQIEKIMENTKKNFAGKTEEIKEKAQGFMDNLKDKAADLLNKGADKASEFADKLGK